MQKLIGTWIALAAIDGLTTVNGVIDVTPGIEATVAFNVMVPPVPLVVAYPLPQVMNERPSVFMNPAGMLTRASVPVLVDAMVPSAGNGGNDSLAPVVRGNALLAAGTVAVPVMIAEMVADAPIGQTVVIGKTD